MHSLSQKKRKKKLKGFLNKTDRVTKISFALKVKQRNVTDYKHSTEKGYLLAPSIVNKVNKENVGSMVINLKRLLLNNAKKIEKKNQKTFTF